MQKVDEDVMERLIDRFFDIDVQGIGCLSVGHEVPNAQQVKEMQAIVEGTQINIIDLWKKHMQGHYKLPMDIKQAIAGVKEATKVATIRAGIVSPDAQALRQDSMVTFSAAAPVAESKEDGSSGGTGDNSEFVVEMGTKAAAVPAGNPAEPAVDSSLGSSI